MRRLCLGDIHGRYDYLMDVLKKSNFDYEKDQLIQIGDLVDRGPDPFLCIKELMKIKNKILIIGNHDAAFVQFVAEGIDFLGSSNGTEPTIEAWRELSPEEQIDILQNFFKKQRLYYISNDNIMFVHGGFPRDEKLDEVTDHVFYWDRELVSQAMSCKGDQKLKTLYDFKEIFIGHTPTIYWNKIKPIYSGGVWNIDTGCGKGGPLTIMDIDTHEYWQSDLSLADHTKLKSYGIPTKDKSTEVSEIQEGEEETTTERKAA